jgi:hypothetical protein
LVSGYSATERSRVCGPTKQAGPLRETSASRGPPRALFVRRMRRLRARKGGSIRPSMTCRSQLSVGSNCPRPVGFQSRSLAARRQRITNWNAESRSINGYTEKGTRTPFNRRASCRRFCAPGAGSACGVGCLDHEAGRAADTPGGHPAIDRARAAPKPEMKTRRL